MAIAEEGYNGKIFVEVTNRNKRFHRTQSPIRILAADRKHGSNDSGGDIVAQEEKPNNLR